MVHGFDFRLGKFFVEWNLGVEPMVIHFDIGSGVMDCGGKRSATPLFTAKKSAVAAALCRRSPKRQICRCHFES
jgi:hypothetical protein